MEGGIREMKIITMGQKGVTILAIIGPRATKDKDRHEEDPKAQKTFYITIHKTNMTWDEIQKNNNKAQEDNITIKEIFPIEIKRTTILTTI
jgi:hypothetical protein